MIARVRSLAEIRRPVRGRVTVAAVFQAIAAALSVVPMVAVVEIGRRLLEGRTDRLRSIEGLWSVEGLWPIAWLAVGLLAVRLVLYLVSGLVSHLADAELAITLRRRLADHLAVLPLRWFAGGVSAKVKTTVQDDVDSGSVMVGGTDVRELSTVDLMAAVSLVFQDVHLFDGTIEENIRLGRPGATAAQVDEAARRARVDPIAERLPDGWASRVGEGGRLLSGGERQRVAIARALLKDSPIVLLDEATSALDAENEVAIHEALRELAAGRTLLVIAHRLSTITAAEHIAVLDGGVVAELGRHEDLLAAGGRYARLWHEHERARGWRITAREA